MFHLLFYLLFLTKRHHRTAITISANPLLLVTMKDDAKIEQLKVRSQSEHVIADIYW